MNRETVKLLLNPSSYALFFQFYNVPVG